MVLLTAYLLLCSPVPNRPWMVLATPTLHHMAGKPLSSLPKGWGLENQVASSPPDTLTVWVKWVLKLDPQGQILQ